MHKLNIAREIQIVKLFNQMLALLTLLALMIVPVFAQAPVQPAQPNAQFYGVQSLYTFPVYADRASYTLATGKRAPACDASMPQKFWFDATVDTSDPSNVTVYQQVALVGSVYKEKQYILSSSVAASVNLPGYEVYPTYVPADTGGIVGTFQGTTGIIPSAAYLSTPDQAAAVLAAIGDAGSVLGNDGAFAGESWNFGTDTRRFFTVKVMGRDFNIGQLLQYQLYKAGIGAPGSWDLSNVSAGPIYTPIPPVVCDPSNPASKFAPVAPVPVRPLLGNEEFTSGLTGPGVERNDLAASTDAVSFTLADRALLNQILVLLQNLAVGK